jgi:3-hydroxyacyl-[acyl-carrier-protein] dehydratase
MAEDPIALGLPHREPFIFVDRVLSRVGGESAEAEKTFPRETPFFAGHFPGAPLVPGVILAEALAQTAGLAAGHKGAGFRLAALKSMKFPSSAEPGETIHLHAQKIASIGALWQFETRATVGDRVVAEGIVVLAEHASPSGASSPA